MISHSIVIGDVHGEYDQLARLLESPFVGDRHIVFVGDLIDRGPHSSAVLDLVMSIAEERPIGTSVLRGNHEQALLEFLDGESAGAFLRNGGMSTMASYYKQVPPNVLLNFRETFPQKHLKLLQTSLTHIETDELLISHMGYDPQRPFARDLRAMVLEPHYELFNNTAPSPVALTVCGHYAQRVGEPFISESLICIDSGCGTIKGAPLSAILLPERIIVRSNVEGEVK